MYPSPQHPASYTTFDYVFEIKSIVLITSKFLIKITLKASFLWEAGKILFKGLFKLPGFK